jgi:hypothetical protein
MAGRCTGQGARHHGRSKELHLFIPFSTLGGGSFDPLPDAAKARRLSSSSRLLCRAGRSRIRMVAIGSVDPYDLVWASGEVAVEECCQLVERN